jgi:hypothetical protein
MELIMQYLPFFIPIFILQIVLMVVALIHVLRHDHYKHGNRVLWIIVVIVVNIIGPIVYFAFGRSDD